MCKALIASQIGACHSHAKLKRKPLLGHFPDKFAIIWNIFDRIAPRAIGGLRIADANWRGSQKFVRCSPTDGHVSLFWAASHFHAENSHQWFGFIHFNPHMGRVPWFGGFFAQVHAASGNQGESISPFIRHFQNAWWVLGSILRVFAPGSSAVSGVMNFDPGNIRGAHIF